MIAHMSFVRCDLCGRPAQLGDTAKEARLVAAQEGFLRNGNQDICPRCMA